MELNEYQAQARKTAVYPGQGSDTGIVYCVLGIASEGGEVADVLKDRIMNGEVEGFVDRLVIEAGDGLWHIANLCTELGITLEDLAEINLDKLAKRADAGTLREKDDR